MNKMKVALATALKFPNWQLCRLCLLLLLFAGTWQGSHAAYMYVKGTASPYFKIDNGSYGPMTRQVSTTDGAVWYFTSVTNGATVTFATSNDGANASPAITFDSSKDSYFDYKSNKRFGINLTRIKNASSYIFLEISRDDWFLNDAGSYVYAWNNDGNNGSFPGECVINKGNRWSGDCFVGGNFGGSSMFLWTWENIPQKVKVVRSEGSSDWNGSGDQDYVKGDLYKSGENWYRDNHQMYTDIIWPSREMEQLSFTGNFYGPGYYRAFNGQSGKNLDVVSNIGDIHMTAVNMADNTHALHSDAGSIVSLEFLDESSLQLGMPYGLYNICSQGSGTQVITSGMMEMFNSILSSVIGSTYPLPYIPVNINPARTAGEMAIVPDGTNGSLYQASFNMVGLTALFRDNHGVAQTAIGNNFGFAMDATYASANFQQLAASYFPVYDSYCNWYLSPTNMDGNYYTPPYNNSTADGYINDGVNNWATVYVDFPFILPEGAKAYLIDENGDLHQIDWNFIPDNTPVLLSWPGVSTDDVKLLPGMLPLSQQQALSSTLVSRIPSWFNYSFSQIYDMVTTPETYQNAVDAFGQVTIDYIYSYGVNMMDAAGVSEEEKQQLLQLEKPQFFAAVRSIVDEYLNATVPEGASTEETNLIESRAMMAANIRQVMVNGIRNKYFYDNYKAVFDEAIESAKALSETYKSQANSNCLVWCGDFFGYDPEHSSNAAQVIPFDGYSMLSGAVNDEPVFDDPVTEWNGNMAYLDQLSHTLQWIMKKGSNNTKYKIKDDLQVAYAYYNTDVSDDVIIFAKDDNNCAAEDRSVNSQNAIDYMANQYFCSAETNTGQYDDQSNWIEIHMPFDMNNNDETSLQGIAESYWEVGAGVANVLSKKIVLTDVQGTYLVNNGNHILNVTGYNRKVSENDINVNTFIPANFYESEVQQGCFFVRPKTLEVAFFDWGIWNSTKSAFVIPKKSEDGTINGFGLHGGFNVNLTYAEINSNSFNDGYAYRFYGVVRKKSNSKRANAFEYNQDEPLNGDYEVWPFYIENPQGIITSVADVKVNRQVAGVEYVNLAGQRSAKPWQGVNIVVTRYTDGTTRSTKAIM